MDRKVAISLLLVPLFVGCYNSFSSLETDNSNSAPTVNATIEHLHSLYDLGRRHIDIDMAVRGTVSANDESGNLFWSIFIESDGYALEVLLGLYDGYASYPLGADIILSLNGLAMSKYNGVLRVGLPSGDGSSFDLDYFEAAVIADKYIWLEALGDEVEPQTISLSAHDFSPNIGSLVRVDSLRFAEEMQCQWSGYHLFCTPQMDSLWCNTSKYASFSEEYIPCDELSLVGIYELGAVDTLPSQHIIRMRDEMDCIY